MKSPQLRIKSHVLLLYLILASAVIAAAAQGIPQRLTDGEFWNLATSLSEEDGTFRSDNLLSNELAFQYVIPELLETTRQGRVYLGVGPEQNFTYIAALKPAMAFIIDIRHGNFDLHLLYKALFELSEDRADFVSRLFSRKRPAGLNSQSSAQAIFSAYLAAEASKDLYDENLKTIVEHLKTKHGFSLSDGDVEGIEWALSNFYRFGPSISYNSSSPNAAPAIVGSTGFGGGRAAGGVTYADLMMADDGVGRARSYLATEENFAVLKALESRNLIVPVVGDFGGPKAIREVGKYLKSVDTTVTAFYLSNVEQYLVQDGKLGAFMANVASLPLDQSSTFIRSGRFAGGFGRGGLASDIGNILLEVRPYSNR
jgi:hypothetical protein